jgi:hypothetical protein
MGKETYKEVELAGRKWRVGKFDAQTGSYIAYQLLFNMLPMGLDSQLGNLPKDRPQLSKADFLDLQRECLMVCSEVQLIDDRPAVVPVMMRDGRWYVEGLDSDTLTVIALTMHALVHNIASFFDEDLLGSVMGSFKGLNLTGSNVQT